VVRAVGDYPIAVPWARHGWASRLLARLIAPQRPPLLILSLPRSGSTWVGATLGLAGNALYLSEPINVVRQLRGNRPVMQQLVGGRPPADYARLARLAFAAVPAFPRAAVPHLGQWRLGERRQRRPVIKEVNPLVAAWLVGQFRPRVILLLRHPAAIALSYQQLGWSDAPWDRLGERLAKALAEAWRILATYPDSCVIGYEELCLEPEATFRRLYDFAGLAWSDSISDFIRRNTTEDAAKPVTRRSQEMPWRWKNRVQRDELAALRSAWLASDLPWYRADEEWRLE
jgi:hypothetical protein